MRPRPSFHPCLICFSLAVAGFPVVAVAQDPAERAGIEAFRDSIASTSDSIGLLALERRMIASAKADRRDALQHVRLGFLSLRLGDLGGHSHYDDAASEFQWASELQAGWPYAWYGSGLAEYGVGDSQVSPVAGLQAMFGKDHLTRAAAAFARSAEVDPSFTRGLVELASTALEQRINIKLTVALDALRRAAATSAADHSEVLLYRGRVEREAGDADSAAAAFRGYLTHGGLRGLGLLELARTEFLRGSFDGVQPYFEGAEFDDSISVAGYRADLAYIASDSVLREFDANRGRYRGAFLRRFWSERDEVELRRPGERIREHYRRIFYARRNFALVSTKRHYGIVERYRSGSRDFDDRGVIYVRHGEPTERATYSSPGLDPNESWMYARADGDLLFHFIAREDVQDFKLVESALDVLGFRNNVLLRGGMIGDTAAARETRLILESRQGLSSIYDRMLAADRAGMGRFATQERSIGQRSIAVGGHSDSYELRFERPLSVRTEVHLVGRDSLNPLFHVSYAIRGRSMEPIATSRGNVYPVRVRLTVLDRQGRVVAAVDSIRYFVSREPVPAGDNLVGHLTVPVPAGPLTYRVAVQQGEDAGTVVPRDSVLAERVDGSIFAVSDLVLGHRSANVSWRPTPTDTVFFNPLETYARDAVMELYYEVYGLAAEAGYRSQIVVSRRGGGGGVLGPVKRLFGISTAAVSLTFEDRADGPATFNHRAIALDRLSPADYRIDLIVTNAEGQRERRTRTFTVVPAKPPMPASSP